MTCHENRRPIGRFTDLAFPMSTPVSREKDGRSRGSVVDGAGSVREENRSGWSAPGDHRRETCHQTYRGEQRFTTGSTSGTVSPRHGSRRGRWSGHGSRNSTNCSTHRGPEFLLTGLYLPTFPQSSPRTGRQGRNGKRKTTSRCRTRSQSRRSFRTSGWTRG